MNNIGTDQAVWMHSLISAFVFVHIEAGFLPLRLYILRGRGQIYCICFVVVVFCILMHIDKVIMVNITQMTCFSESKFGMPCILYNSDQRR